MIVHVWKGDVTHDPLIDLARITAAGYRAIYSSCWYLNLIKYGSDWSQLPNADWARRGLYYQCDPTDFVGTDEQKKLVIGGEATMWGEFVDATNLVPRLW